MFCLQGFVCDINAKEKQELYKTIYKNFTNEDDKIRLNSIKLMSLLLSDISCHETMFVISNLQFLIGDVDELSLYPSLYAEEQELLLYVLRVFGEFARTQKVSDYNLTNGLLTTCLRIISEPSVKFAKETRIWALTIINRGCQHTLNELNTKTMQVCFNYLPPTFLRFLMTFIDPEDPDYTNNSQGIFATMEQLASVKNVQLIQTFTSNADLIEKLLSGTKKMITSTSSVGGNLRNIINFLRTGSPECDRMIREATKKLSSRV